MLQSLFPRHKPSPDPYILLGQRGHLHKTAELGAASARPVPLCRDLGLLDHILFIATLGEVREAIVVFISQMVKVRCRWTEGLSEG